MGMRKAAQGPARLFGQSVRGILGLGAVLVIVAGLFIKLTVDQFAAPAGGLFGTPDARVEAGYCLSVAQDISPAVQLPGSYIREARGFWQRRLVDQGGDLAGGVAVGRARLARDILRARGRTREWLEFTMSECSYKALSHGAWFQAFDDS
ncbi:hypothetical protein ERN12_01345 [Rhodobacteraceae bacterium]|nr:hypothetical protein ERN12_01345 [Paracoccaceae bacterium]